MSRDVVRRVLSRRAATLIEVGVALLVALGLAAAAWTLVSGAARAGRSGQDAAAALHAASIWRRVVADDLANLIATESPEESLFVDHADRVREIRFLRRKPGGASRLVEYVAARSSAGLFRLVRRIEGAPDTRLPELLAHDLTFVVLAYRGAMFLRVSALLAAESSARRQGLPDRSAHGVPFTALYRIPTRS